MFIVFRQFSRNIQSFQVVILEMIKVFSCLSRNFQGFLDGLEEMFKVFRQFSRKIQSFQVFILEMIKVFSRFSRNVQGFLDGQEKTLKVFKVYLEMINVFGVYLENFEVFRCLYRSIQSLIDGLLEMIKVSQVVKLGRNVQRFQVVCQKCTKFLGVYLRKDQSFRCLSRNVQSFLGG